MSQMTTPGRPSCTPVLKLQGLACEHTLPEPEGDTQYCVGKDWYLPTYPA